MLQKRQPGNVNGMFAFRDILDYVRGNTDQQLQQQRINANAERMLTGGRRR